ncbi:unnamed protein product [Rotaria sp. Silwood2]|nr:unnamed protein product [Rotaria sp. Silwood2]CAF4113458.1 unnamed protein product [Rotaria sp. Silwood2]
MSITSETPNLEEDITLKLQLVSFLVDGVLFELSEELIQKRASNSILAREDRRAQFYDVDKNAYVFDQPADAFEVLVYFISTGLLSRPTNINNLKLYSLLSFFEMDETIMNTFKKMEHLVFEINWEKTQWFVKFATNFLFKLNTKVNKHIITKKFYKQITVLLLKIEMTVY